MKKLFIITTFMLYAMVSNVLNAQIISVTPEIALQGEALEIKVTAENVNFSQGSNVVYFTQGSTTLHADKFDVTSSTTFTVYFTFTASNPTGYYDLTIYAPGRTVSKTNAIYVTPDLKIASLDSIKPNTASQGENVTITLYGTKTNFDKAGITNSVYLNNGSKQINAIATNPIDSVTLEAQFNFGYGHPVGLYSIFVHNTTDGLINISNAFNLLKGTDSPAIITVNPDTVTQGETLDIEVTAQNINFTQGTNIVYLKHGSTEFIVSHSTVKSATTLTFNYTFTSDNPFGYYDLRIWNSSKTLTKTNAIYVTPDLTIASIDNITPDNANQGENVTITLYGTNTNFNKAGITNSVYLNNGSRQINAISTNPIDSVTLEAQFKFGYAHTVGLYSIFVNNATDGIVTIPNAFGLLKGPNPPAILTVNPDTVTQGQPLDIEVTAENVDFTQGTNIIYFIHEGTILDMLNVTVTSATTLTINYGFMSNDPSGNYDLSIWNTSSEITLKKNNAIFVNPDLTIALIDSIAPKTALQGESITITVYGTNTNFTETGVTNYAYMQKGYKEIYAKSIKPIDSQTLEVQFELTYAYTVGLYSISVYNILDGTITKLDAFGILEGLNAPAILTVTPDTLEAGKTLDIEVTAENIDFTQGTNVVSLKQGSTEIYMNFSSANSPTSLSANFTLSNGIPSGNYNLSIWNTSFDIMLVADQTLVKEKAFYLKSKAITGLTDIQDNKTYFYPNPVNNFLYLEQKYELSQLFDLKGRKILEAKYEDILNVSGLQKGMYLIKLKKGNIYIVKKLMVE